MAAAGCLQQLCSDFDRGMPNKAKRDKERKWKLARNAVWECVPARLVSEVPATWVPAPDWSSRSCGKSVAASASKEAKLY